MEILNFSYNNKEYKAIIKKRVFEESIFCKITIMNGDLEKLLFAHNTIQIKKNELCYKSSASVEQLELLEILGNNLLHLND